MPMYLCRGSYTVEGIQGLLKDGATRREHDIAAALEGIGGKLHDLYYGLGETDIYIICELRDNTAAVASSILINVAGTAEISCTPLLTPKEMDRSIETVRRKMDVYRPPGA